MYKLISCKKAERIMHINVVKNKLKIIEINKIVLCKFFQQSLSELFEFLTFFFF